MLLRILLLLAPFLAPCRGQDDLEDLGTVLEKHKNLTMYYDLIKKYPDVLLQLPSYSGVTIIAPSNEAFENIPYTALNAMWNPDNKTTTVPLLQYHIMQGTVATSALISGPSLVRPTLLTSPVLTNVTGGQNVLVTKQPGDVVIFTTSLGTRCTVTEADIPFRGGLVQIVDNLLIPPAGLRATADAFKVTSFVGGLYAADLMPETAERRNVTLFVPRDEAFDLIGATLEDLDEDALARVMGYHVVPDQVIVSSSLTNGTRLTTAARAPAAAGGSEDTLLVRQAGNSIFVNSAQIVQPDVLIANGIMHIIANVVNPDAPAVEPNPEVGTQPPVFAPSSMLDPFTSDLPCTVSCPVTTTATTTASETDPGTATELSTSESDGAAAARCTGQVAGSAIGIGVGVLGVGAGLAFL